MEVQNYEDKALLLRFAHVNILFEMPLDDLHLLSFSPPSLLPSGPKPSITANWINQVDLSSIDLIIISNTLTLQGLPFLKDRYQGPILMTELVH